MSSYKHILVAVDFSPTTPPLVIKALDLVSGQSSHLTLHHVVEYLPPLDLSYEPISSPDWLLEETELKKSAQKSLQEFSEKMHLNNADLVVTVGTPKYEIVQVANEKKVDLIVIGSHGRHGLKRLLGSTADGVLHLSNKDVLAVRLQES